MNKKNFLNSNSKLLDNILFFSRVLRTTGISISTSQIMSALNAIKFVGIKDRIDLYYTLKTCLINDNSHFYIFDQTFNLLFKENKNLNKFNDQLSEKFGSSNNESIKEEKNISNRVLDSLFPNLVIEKKNNIISEEKVSVNEKISYSFEENFNQLDFESMSNSEILTAKIAISKFSIQSKKIKSRRLVSNDSGKYIDPKNSFVMSVKNGSSSILLKYKSNKLETSPLIILCDISGSMSSYSRMFLHFIHALTEKRKKVSTFLFGTRLTNITRYLKYYDIDIALDNVSKRVLDWSGGTRIGECIRDYNRYWSKRVESGNSIVLIITDGLDRGSSKKLEKEMQRLKKTCYKIIWLNPLLRYEKYEALASGAAAMLPHVSEMRKIHNLNSMKEFTESLNQRI
ncbi:MAG: hypothetical protein CFH01_00339 [Alphaproteobacteria bacterium MarineAlpha2_Bin1]|nr:MAG: hypothetical protein CFH01_00339 [Alphaproteobacteria bacterium MarineAlpha2_Bin1]|tara:strand:+ start:3820 stop:5016 length:1197 start_codon:yes stop_codon:yes gene_type:complete